MKKKKVGHKVERFTRHQLDKHRALLASAPDVVEKRQHKIDHRNQMLAGIQAYNLGLERTRMQSHLATRPGALQRLATDDYIGDLTKRIHKLAQTGLP